MTPEPPFDDSINQEGMSRMSELATQGYMESIANKDLPSAPLNIAKLFAVVGFISMMFPGETVLGRVALPICFFGFAVSAITHISNTTKKLEALVAVWNSKKRA